MPITSLHNSNMTSAKIGPRAKCDQVVYEAIAKAAEIIVFGRCQIPSSTNTNITNNNNNNVNVSSRFNLEMPEVETIRSILSMWKKSLHVPLRLDIYYQYTVPQSMNESDNHDPNNLQVRKELLERWCIDYMPSRQYDNSTSSDYNSYSYHNNLSTTGGSSHHNVSAIVDDTISQLRQVCKRVVVFLRTLHLFTRMMPAYRLFHSFQQLESLLSSSSSGNSQQQQQSHYNVHNTSGYYNPSTTTNHNYKMIQIINDLLNFPTMDKELFRNVGGEILFSFHVSETTFSNDSHSTFTTGGATNHAYNDHTTLFSSSSNTPFTRHTFNPIPTPYGTLHFTSLYDSTLDLEHILMERMSRFTILRDYFVKTSITRAIPIHPPNNHKNNNNNNKNSSYSSCHGSGDGSHEYQMQQQQQQQQQQLEHHHTHHFTSETTACSPSSLPTAYFQNTISAPQPPASFNTAKSMNTTFNHGIGTRDRLSSDPMTSARNNANIIMSPRGGGGGENDRKTTLSGLSLALMQDNNASDHSNIYNNKSHNHPHTISRCNTTPIPSSNVRGNEHDHNDNTQSNSQANHQTPPSPHHPQLIRTHSGDEAALIRQRRALHHPPPSFIQNNQSNIGYGYGYNQSSNDHPNASTNQQLLSSYSRSKSPSPLYTNQHQHHHPPHRQHSPSPSLLSNTPPQPVFIGSLSRRNSLSSQITSEQNSIQDTSSSVLPRPNNNSFEDNVKIVRNGGLLSPPPFKNPTSLQDDSMVRLTQAQAASTLQNNIQVTTAPSAISDTCNHKGDQINHEKSFITKAESELLPPLTPFDILPSSPFLKSKTCNGTAEANMIISSSSSNHHHLHDDFISSGSISISLNNHLLFGGGIGGCFNESKYYDMQQQQRQEHDDDMPFAVELEPPNIPTCSGETQGKVMGIDNDFKDNSKPATLFLNNNTTHNHNLVNSSSAAPLVSASPSASILNASSSSHMVTSFANRCAQGGRLKMFQSNENYLIMQQQKTADVDAPSKQDDLNTRESKKLSFSSSYSSQKGINSIYGSAKYDNDKDGNIVVEESIESLVNQLAEFRTFAAESLMIESASALMSSVNTE